jgi:hypothetical protein
MMRVEAPIKTRVGRHQFRVSCSQIEEKTQRFHAAMLNYNQLGMNLGDFVHGHFFSRSFNLAMLQLPTQSIHRFAAGIMLVYGQTDAGLPDKGHN